ncbi:MAG TPA: CHAT domain-containing tetratricopeptide repeat protein [Pyrinomonadaceae bacterium]|jgi:CHAT domain-containing protein/tetratricopeptide (TPR) repeat protein
MSFKFRALLCLLALSLSLINPAPAQPRSLTYGSHASPDEAALRGVVERYFVLYAAKDLDGMMGLWSDKSPDFASLKKSLQKQFAAENFSFGPPVISRVRVEGEKASLRTATDMAAVNPKTGVKREQRLVHNFSFAREGGQWKIWRSVPAEEELAEALAKATTEPERAELLAAEKELQTVALSRALISQAGRFYERGEYPSALAINGLAQSIAEQIGDRYEVGRALRNIGHVHRALGNHAQAMTYFEKSLAIYESLGDQTGIGLAFMGIGLIHMALGNYAESFEYYQKSLTIFEATDNKDVIARLLNNIGSLKRYQGDYAQALDYYRKALAINQELENRFGIETSMLNLGVVYSIQGNFAKALDYYQKSLALSEAAEDKEGIAITLGNIGVIHRKQGNYAQALDYYRKSLAVSEAIGDKVGIAQMVNNIGSIHFLQGNNEQALEYYRKSLAMREEAGDKNGSSNTMMSIGAVLTAQGNHALASEYYRKSLAIKEAIGDKDGVAQVLVSLAIDNNKQGRYAQALDYVESATALARQVGNPAVLWKARYNAGLAYRALDRPDQARLGFEEAIAIIEAMRAQVAGSEQEQQRFFEDKLSPYHAMVDLLVARNNPGEALAFAERAKARTLLDLLYAGRVNIVKAMTGQEQEQERRLRAEIISLNTQVTRAGQQAKPDPARLSELKLLREKARLNYEAFQTSLYAAHPELKVKRGEAPIIRAQELAALLPDAASALFEYTVAGDAVYLFAVTRADGKSEAEVRVYKLQVKRDELSKEIEAFRLQLAGRDLGFRARAAKLYELLLKPAAEQLRGKTNLIIVPDNTLWDLPFQALLSDPGRFLIEEAAIAYAPSLTALREMARRRKDQSGASSPTTLLALGNPLSGQGTANRQTPALRDEKLGLLPESEQEVRALSRLYGASRSRVYTGTDAREDRFKAEAAQARILHFATHGVLNNASPMYSYLALADGGVGEDGLLEAWELMQLDLKADLAVLSACETARGRVGTGEGIIGVSWAMFIAGVPSVVVSQWKVEAAGTRDLMVNFHRSVIAEPVAAKSTPSRAEALREASLKLMKNPVTSHPFYWAGFVLVGDGR